MYVCRTEHVRWLMLRVQKKEEKNNLEITRKNVQNVDFLTLCSALFEIHKFIYFSLVVKQV